MKTYLVGGAVRDKLLGKQPKDEDFVIVGATQSDVDKMIADGFTQVGADFPVFLHPVTGNEYALARVERKTGNGYGGFTVDTENVTLEQDLSRRDITINAMAQDIETGEIFDPFGGQHDLAQGILRHVSVAFAEDPLRVLRVARFAARYGFTVAKDTIQMMSDLVNAGELDHLSRERIWTELEKILGEKDAVEGLSVLAKVGALRNILCDPFANEVLDIVMLNKESFNAMNVTNKFVLLTHLFTYSDDWMSENRIPNEVRKAYKLFNKIHNQWAFFDALSAKNKIAFFNEIRAFSDMTVFNSIQQALKWKFPEHFVDTFHSTLQNAKKVDCAAIAMANKADPATAIFNARVDAIS